MKGSRTWKVTSHLTQGRFVKQKADNRKLKLGLDNRDLRMQLLPGHDQRIQDVSHTIFPTHIILDAPPLQVRPGSQ